MKQKRYSRINSRRLLNIVRTACLTGALVAYGAGAYAEVSSNAVLPSGGTSVLGGASWTTNDASHIMNVSQTEATAVIKWDSFNIGSIATVNFEGNGTEGYNILNYVNAGGSMSQIHGTMNALNNGNVYLVNPAGVFIGKSAQIDVGSLHISNKKLDTDSLANFNGSNLNDLIAQNQPASAAELMSLGHINANSVTFDGDRIVLDTANLTTSGSTNPMIADNIHITTTNAENVVLGYDGYDEGQYLGEADEKHFNITTVEYTEDNGTTTKTETPDSVKGYMWVEDVEQLQAINTNLSGNYALRNGIDATNTAEISFTSIGDEENPFTGKLDGLAGRVDGVDFAIFDLHVAGKDNVGLFGVTQNATIKNLLLTSGEISGTGDNIGAVAGKATNTVIENISSSVNVTGANIGADGNASTSSNVGGIVGLASDTEMSGLLNTGKIQGHSNVGGIVGAMQSSSLTDSRNIGKIQGIDSRTGSGTEYSNNIGGLAGRAATSELQDLKNDLNVTGGYNVGGIVGSIDGTAVQNVTNSGSITADGYTIDAYKYHTNNSYEVSDADDNNAKIAEKPVLVANAGGIVGLANGTEEVQKSSITGATNTGDVKTVTENEKDSEGNTYEYHIAGNVGGIVGSASGTDISSVENKENAVFGAHNVGGIAGFFTEGTISAATNNGGEIKATGARDTEGFATEWIRPYSEGANGQPSGPYWADKEEVIIGNIGGIAGYLYGANAKITGSGNRGTVHSEDIGETVLPINQAANVGGIAGKIDKSSTDNLNDKLSEIKVSETTATISNSYNTGDVRGYTGVGGIAGMMYNGEIASSYNLGNLRSTFKGDGYAALNMGGIVGDSTENTNAEILLYDVYNKGKIGDESFTYYGRHVGGIVGRLSGTVEKAYNTGAIYNASVSNGGIAGWWYKGDIKDVFNTGNITVINRNTEPSRVGGIAGSAKGTGKTLTNAYNLGTLRTFTEGAYDSLGGIIGQVINGSDITISNVYTVGELYCAYEKDGNYLKGTDAVGAIIGPWSDGYDDNSSGLNIKNAYYIQPRDTKTFNDFSEDNYSGWSHAALNSKGEHGVDKEASYWLYGATAIKYEDRFNSERYDFSFDGSTPDSWRIYTDTSTGTTPILNAFMPSMAETANEWKPEDSAVQYGTAYDPLLTIVKLNSSDTQNTLNLDWKKAGISRNESLAVYNGGLSIKNFVNATDSNYYGGLIYSDGALEIASDSYAAIRLGSASDLYGSSVNITNSGDVIAYGNITATGSTNASSIDISGSSVEIIGSIASAEEGKTTTVNGIDTAPFSIAYNGVTDPWSAMPDVGAKYNYVTNASQESGSITITATAENGSAEILLGNEKSGLISSAGDITVKGSSVYVDSDLSAGGNITLDAETSVLDLSNIGAVTEQSLIDFANDFSEENKKITFDNSREGSQDVSTAMITLDMWNEAAGSFDLNKYDEKNDDGTTKTALSSALSELNVSYKTPDTPADQKETSVFPLTYIWISDAEQLAGIQPYYENHSSSNILSYNFALKNNIDATELKDYTPIGRTHNEKGENNSVTAYTGTFNGRDYDIIGLNVTGNLSVEDSNIGREVGIFAHIGRNTITDDSGNKLTSTGAVKNLNIISGSFTGASVGAVAGFNEGTIENITTFGNRIESNGYIQTTVLGQDDNGKGYLAGAAGGIAGINTGSIANANVNDAVIAGITGKSGEGSINSLAGGIAGINAGGSASIYNSAANSAVTANHGNANGLGGIVGLNYDRAEVNLIESLGIVNGNYKGIKTDADGNSDDNPVTEIRSTENIGGIAGVNYNGAEIRNAYNEAHLTGSNGVGGIVGYTGGKLVNKITNAVNAGTVISSSEGLPANELMSHNAGGLVGNSINTDITNARNVGTVTGEGNVGGLVGTNGKGSSMDYVSNDGTATITGIYYVGGIAGINESTITAPANDDTSAAASLVNKGAIYGVQYVGGIAGSNKGTINNAVSDITLNINEAALTESSQAKAQYFGGTAGINEKGAVITSAVNHGAVIAHGAEYVGGIVGYNDGVDGNIQDPQYGSITGAGNSNTGKVVGASYVGGVVGLNKGSVSGTNEEITKISNEGLVIAEAGGAGGIIGVNHTAISNSRLVNSGIVLGTKYSGTDSALSGTGGVIGVNEAGAAIYDSDLINTVDGIVISLENAGGVIGVNKASVSGGRDTTKGGGNYYAHQVYNNGTVIGGIWQKDPAKEDDPDIYTTLTTNDQENIYYRATTGSQNTGGLIGENTVSGSLTAAYNTGVVSGGTNVGGVAGSNAGTIDQVFNTVAKWKDNKFIDGAVSGTSSVGGVVGNNAGTIKNAYNTSSVVENETSSVPTITTNAIGNNPDTSIAEDKTLWKTYGDGTEYGTDKLLSVFLTKLTFNPSTSLENFIYNAQKQGYYVKADENNVICVYKYADNTCVGTIDTVSTDAAQAHSLEDYLNSMSEENLNDLLAATVYTNAGTYSMFSSQQINTNAKSGSNNPNNLGYDIDKKFTINKYTITTSDDLSNPNADMTLVLNDLYRTYGNDAAYRYNDDGSKSDLPKDDSKYQYNNVQYGGELNYTMVNQLKAADAWNFTYMDNSDKAVNDLADGKTTDNVGNYNWTGTVTLSDELYQNYQFNYGSKTADFTGSSIVEKAGLTLSLSDVYRVYGDKNLSDGYSYGISNFNGLTNGDEESGSVSISDNASGITDNALSSDSSSGAVTKNAGEYIWKVTEDNISASGFSLDNYNIEILDGTSVITPAELTLNLSEVKRTYGNANLGGYSYAVASVDGLVNGDETAETYENISGMFDVTKTSDGAVDNLTGSKTSTNDAGNYKWTGTATVDNDLINNNYTFKVVDGSSVVEKANMVINLNDIQMTYGDSEEQHIGSYGAADSYKNYLVNGDENTVDDISKIVTITGYENTGFYTDKDGITKTHDVDNIYSLNAASSNTVNGNYNVTINSGKVTIAQKELSVNDFAATVTYGQQNINWKDALSTGGSLSGKAYESDYVSFSIGDVSVKENSAYSGNRENRDTANVGSYDESLAISGITLSGNQSGNYKVNTNALGRIDVSKADLTVKVGDAKTTYGTAFDPESYSYTLTGYTNGDTVDSVKALLGVSSSNYANSAALDDSDGKVTQDAAVYTNAVSLNNLKELQNYNVTVENGDATVNKAALTVNLSDVIRTYGNDAITKGSYSVSSFSGLVNGDKTSEAYENISEMFKVTETSDGAIDGRADGKATNDAGEYSWSGSVEAKAGFDDGRLAQNYDIIVNNGSSIVERAGLSVTIGNASTTYGTAFNPGSYSYTLSGVTNGDSSEAVRESLGVSENDYNNSAAKTGYKDIYTIDAGTYAGAVSNSKLTEGAAVGNNYTITAVANGTATISRADLTISLNDVRHTYGTPNLDGYAVESVSGLTNGDQAAEKNLSVTMTSDAALKDNNTHTRDVKDSPYGWAGDVSGIENLEKNYNINIEKGKSYVDKAKLTITVNNTEIKPGEKPEYSGSINGLTNGDTEDALDIGGFAYEDGDTPSSPGKYDDKIGITVGKDVIVTEEKLSEILSNYEVDFAPGDLTVTDTGKPDNPDKPNPPVDPDDPDEPNPPVDPDNPDKPNPPVDPDDPDEPNPPVDPDDPDKPNPPVDPDDPDEPNPPVDPDEPDKPNPPDRPVITPDDLWQAEDKYPWYQWDKQRNERERKAEINFVKGGMEI